MPHEFDAYTDNYESALNLGLGLTGETRDYYSRRRVAFTRELCRHAGVQPRRVLDFGCGTGDTLPLLRAAFDRAEIAGLEPSAHSRERAVRETGASCFAPEDLPPDFHADLIYCNGVFHHIPPGQRQAALAQIDKALAPGGLFCIWENNPANPGTRLVMRRIPFDRNAIMLSPGEVKQRGTAFPWRVLHTSFHFYFPRWLQALRPLEQLLLKVPLGGQYVIAFQRE